MKKQTNPACGTSIRQQPASLRNNVIQTTRYLPVLEVGSRERFVSGKGKSSSDKTDLKHVTGQVPSLPEGPGQKSPAFPLLPQGLKPACFFLRPEDEGSGPARPMRTGSGQPAQVSRPRGKISDGGSCDVLTGHGAEPRADRWEVRPRFCTMEAAARSGSLAPGAGSGLLMKDYEQNGPRLAKEVLEATNPAAQHWTL
eukprot:bmy_14423T0